MIENEMEGKDGGDLEARRVRFENERMTRRGALRKFGFMAGMAVFATLSVDDLARIASKKLQDTEATKGIGDTLAREFRAAGVVLANDYPGTPNPYLTDCSGCAGYCLPDADHDCVDCPPECAVGMPGGRRKIAKCANAQGFWNACGGAGGAGYSNRLECCEAKCYQCCTPIRSCGGTQMSKYAIYSTCQELCVKINNGG